MDGTVLGHYVPDARDGWVPTLANSTDLFKSLVADDLTAFERQAAELDASEGSSGSTSSWHTLLYWSGGGLQQAAPPPLVADGSSSTSDAVASKVQAKQRTLLMLATQHGSVRVLAYLLSKGQGCPTDKAPGDGVDCYQLLDERNPNAPSIKGMLDDALRNASSSTGAASRTLPSTSASGAPHAGHTQQPSGGAMGDVCGQDAGGAGEDLEGADLTRPEYSTDWFRMYCFKVLRCSKRYAHDWRGCPFAHPTENARRRDPRDFTYSSLVCPDYRQGCCVRGDTCKYAHGVFESWLHPSRYRTQLCKDHGKCDRPVCFFAHSLEELRSPANNFVPGPEERLRVPEPMQAVLGIGPPAGLPQLQLDTAYGPDQNTQLDLMQQQQHGGLPSGSSSTALNRAASSNTSFGSSSQAAGRMDSGTAPSTGDDQQQQQQGAAGGTSSSNDVAQPSPKQVQLVSPTALPMPRMSNAFARKHGLDPKENPLVNLQRLAMQQASPQQAGMGGQQAGGRRNKRGGSGAPQQQQPFSSPPPAYASQQYPPQQQLPYAQQQYQQQYQQMPAGHQHPHGLLQPLTLQPPQQLLQPPVLSPAGAAAAAAAAYYGAASPMQHMQHSPAASPALDPQAMALLFGGMSISAAPLSPVDPAAAMAMGLASPAQLYALGAASPAGMAGMPAGGMLSPVGVGALTHGMDPTALGAQSPLPQPMMHHPSGALHSPSQHF